MDKPRGAGHDALVIVDSSTFRDRLVAEIRRRRPEFEAAGNRAEELRTVPADTVATLRALD
jgi:hypothetical protein